MVLGSYRGSTAMRDQPASVAPGARGADGRAHRSASPSESNGSRDLDPSRQTPTRTSFVGNDRRAGLSSLEALAALPATAALLYGLGGFALAVQAQQAGMPWMAVLTATPTQTLLVGGVLPLFAAIVATPVFVGLLVAIQQASDRWNPGFGERRASRVATRVGNAVASAIWAASGAVLAMYALALCLLLLDDVFGAPLPLWVRLPASIAAAVVGAWFAVACKKSVMADEASRRRTLVIVLCLVAATWLVIWVLPVFNALMLLVACAAGVYAGRDLQAPRFDRQLLTRGPFLALLGSASLAWTLGIVANTSWQLERVSYSGAPGGSAGLISTTGDDVVMAVCARTRGGRPAEAQLWRVPRADVKILKVGGEAFRLQGRKTSTLVDVLRADRSAGKDTLGSCG